MFKALAALATLPLVTHSAPLSFLLLTLFANSYFGDLTHYGVLMLSDVTTPDDNVYLNRFQEVPLYVIMGCVGGLLGAFFNDMWKRLFLLRKGLYAGRSKWWKVVEVIFLSFLTSFLTFYLSLFCKWACRDLIIDGAGDDDDEKNHWWNDDNNDDSSSTYRFDDGFGHRFNCGVNQTNELARYEASE